MHLLADFFSAAVGLHLHTPNREVSASGIQRASTPIPTGCGPAVLAEWDTDAGPLRARGLYDRTQSGKLRAHVLYIEWWLEPDEHHAGWWHCDTRRPREWTKGRGA